MALRQDTLYSDKQVFCCDGLQDIPVTQQEQILVDTIMNFATKLGPLSIGGKDQFDSAWLPQVNAAFRIREGGSSKVQYVVKGVGKFQGQVRFWTHEIDKATLDRAGFEVLGKDVLVVCMNKHNRAFDVALLTKNMNGRPEAEHLAHMVKVVQNIE